MLAEFGWFSATRMAGLLACSAAALGCGARSAAFRRRNIPDRLFAVLASLQCVLFLDIVFDWRWKLHGLGVEALVAMGIYDERHAPQLVMLASLFSILGLAGIPILLRFRKRIGAVIALIGSLMSVGLWFVECISFHVTDHFLYQEVGGFMVICGFWFAFSAITLLGARVDGTGSAGGLRFFR